MPRKRGALASRRPTLLRGDVAQWICGEVLLRFWSDLRHVLILMMLSWTEKGGSGEPSLQAALLLLQGDAEQFEVIASPDDFIKPAYVVNRVIRQHFVRAAYSRRLDDFCEGAARQRVPWPTPGRVVTRHGWRNLLALDDELLLLLYALAPDGPFPSATPDPSRIAVEGAFDEQQRGRAELLVSTLAEAMTRTGEAPARTLYRHQAIVDAIREALGLPLGMGAGHAWVNGVVAGLQGLADQGAWRSMPDVGDADGLSGSGGWSGGSA